jgi:uncharacterized protein
MDWAQAYRHRTTWIIVPIWLLAGGLFLWLADVFFELPPSSITITAGRSDGMYYQHAKRYASALQAKGLSVELLESAGSGENLQRMRSATTQAQVGFVQGGFALIEPGSVESIDIQTIAQIDIEPVWIFSKMRDVDSLTRFQGMRVAVGQSGSGSRVVANKLFAQVRLSEQEVVFSEHSGQAAVDALAQDQIDAAIFVAAPDAPAVQAMWRVPGVQLAQLRRSAALSERLPYLEPRLATAGRLDAKSRFPQQDMIVLATMASLVVRQDLHPAIKRQLAAAAVDLHSDSGPLHAAGHFPHLKRLEFPSSTQARRTLAYGLPWVELTFDLQTVSWIYRALFIGLPLGLMALLLSRLIPAWLRWTLESHLNRWYGELKFIENDLNQPELAGLDVARHHRQLRNIEQAVRQFKAPLDFNKRLVVLQEHIEFVRQKIYSVRGR